MPLATSKVADCAEGDIGIIRDPRRPYENSRDESYQCDDDNLNKLLFRGHWLFHFMLLAGFITGTGIESIIPQNDKCYSHRRKLLRRSVNKTLDSSSGVGESSTILIGNAFFVESSLYLHLVLMIIFDQDRVLAVVVLTCVGVEADEWILEVNCEGDR